MQRLYIQRLGKSSFANLKWSVLPMEARDIAKGTRLQGFESCGGLAALLLYQSAACLGQTSAWLSVFTAFLGHSPCSWSHRGSAGIRSTRCPGLAVLWLLTWKTRGVPHPDPWLPIFGGSTVLIWNTVHISLFIWWFILLTSLFPRRTWRDLKTKTPGQHVHYELCGLKWAW